MAGVDSSGTERTIGPQGEVRATPGTPRAEFYFDLVDPGSYIVSHVIDQAGAEEAFAWRGLELRPPPEPMIDPYERTWRSRHSEALLLSQSQGLAISEPEFLPWTRKAHELCEFARERDRFHTVRRALFRSHFVNGTDIGRIDLLIEIAHGAGLDRTEAKAVLDVDRYTATILRNRESALGQAIKAVPAVVTAAGRLVDTGSLRDIERLLAEIANGQ